MPEVRSFGDRDFGYVLEEKNGTVLMCDFQIAPWGFDHMGFSEVSREWLEAHSERLPEDHPASRLCQEQ